VFGVCFVLFCVVVVGFGAFVGVLVVGCGAPGGAPAPFSCVVVMFVVVVGGVLWGCGWGQIVEMVRLVWLWGCFVVVPESGVVFMVACYSLGLLTGVCLGWFLFRGVGAITRGKER
jgi:hypothetical protein